ncbi:hypothetical protein SGGMMB4_00789 [Sodalis glossinidius str. 'morsitans']|uniref:Uncharacterized protein n=1 Tax=Sodalis glossinidius (strain morsitans) TaxID=343509 RepID=A0A193QGE5_SODGM|nr:hypothetical protein SGGMMB4_00789 [Sodalis glossinidius str. 'morsitans']
MFPDTVRGIHSNFHVSVVRDFRNDNQVFVAFIS